MKIEKTQPYTIETGSGGRLRPELLRGVSGKLRPEQVLRERPLF